MRTWKVLDTGTPKLEALLNQLEQDGWTIFTVGVAAYNDIVVVCYKDEYELP